MKPVNLPEAKALIVTYRGITLEMIHEMWNKYPNLHGAGIANKLTGFGRVDTCTLCGNAYSVLTGCKRCIYPGSKFGCGCSEFKDTYKAIIEVTSPVQLLQAFRNRADMIENHIKQFE